MKFKIESNYGETLISENGKQLDFKHICQGIDLTTGKEIFIVSYPIDCYEHGGSYKIYGIKVLSLEEDIQLDLEKFKKDYLIDIEVE